MARRRDDETVELLKEDPHAIDDARIISSELMFQHEIRFS